MDEIAYVNKLLEIGDKEGAVKELGQIIRKNPNNVEALFLLGQAVDEPEKKADCYRFILKIDPSNKLAEEKLVEIIKAKSQRSTSQQPVTIDSQVGVKTSIEDKITSQKQAIPEDKPLTSPNQVASYTSPPKTSVKPKNKVYFPARYLTAFFGLGVIIGVALPWYDTGDFYFFQEPNVTGTVLGLETAVGILALIAGCAIIAISIFIKTLPVRPSSPISSIIAFVTLVFIIAWANNSDPSQTSMVTGFYLSMFCLVFSILTGLGINQGRGNPNWITFLSLLLLGLIFIASLIFGNAISPISYNALPIIVFGFFPGLLLLLGILTVVRGSKKVKTI